MPMSKQAGSRRLFFAVAQGLDERRVFVAGATGVVGMTRGESKLGMLRGLGAVPVVADALDPDQLTERRVRARADWSLSPRSSSERIAVPVGRSWSWRS
jgi:hypothetical protein